MAHGAPDYSNVVKPQFTYRVDDLGELAARLSKSTSFERKGETVFYEDFEHGLVNWNTVASGTGAAVSLVANRFMSKGFSVYVKAGSDSGKVAGINKYLPYLTLDKMGLEFGVRLNTNVDYIQQNIIFYDGANQHFASLRYFWIDNKIAYIDENADTITLLADTDAISSDNIWTFMKITVDFANEKYIAGKVNEQSFDMSDLSYWKIASSTNRSVLIQCYVNSYGSNNGTAWFDNIILTRNE